MPTGMPISSSKKMPNRAIIAVAGKRSMIDCATGRSVSYEKPMSPCSRFVQVDPVLLVDRLVEPELGADPFEHLRRRVDAGDALGGVAGHGEGEQERDDADEEQHHHDPQQAAHEVLTHRAQLPLALSPCPDHPLSPSQRAHLPSSFQKSWKLRFQTGW